ncbi:P-loop containing nucleoside triphosphate hydrolase protein [Mycena floridula]|nr:P-loop containing nucleoside triphosphate hydrolase protein [Mycena floridula]
MPVAVPVAPSQEDSRKKKSQAKILSQGVAIERPAQSDDPPGPSARKRQRINKAGHSRTSDEEHSRAAEEGPAGKTLPRDIDGFLPGSIVRMQLKNFVTYDFVEFAPGPRLNMVIGPNGSGKSSIACAICLGLNWSPEILGRGKNISSFVKDQATDGHIEIELKGLIGQKNLVIRRNIVAKNNASTFTLNGVSATGGEVSERMRQLNVQVGNLCSFLPQDKVTEFACMSPPELLKETQRAAGNSHLTSWQETLISEGRELRSMQEMITNETNQITQMRERNAGIERDVQRVRERQKIEHDIALLQILIPVQQYRALYSSYMEAKTQHRKLRDQVRRLRERNAPVHDFLRVLETKAQALEKSRDAMKKSTLALFQKMKRSWDSNEKLETDADDLNHQLDGLGKREDERKIQIRGVEEDIKKTELELKVIVEVENEQTLQTEANELKLERRGLAINISQTNETVKNVINQRSHLETRIESLRNQITELDSADAQKLANLRRWDKDAADVLIWLRSNQNRFKKPIIEPVVMSLTVTDLRYAMAVEACFNANQLKTFVAQCHEDYNLFNRLVQDEQCLGRSVRISIWFRPPSESLKKPPPMERDQLKALKFDGYAIDFVAHPPEMLWFLQVDIHLHRTPVALAANIVDVGKAMAAISPAGGASFITGATMHQVSRSRYGQRMMQNMTRSIKKPMNFDALSVDVQRKQALEKDIAAVEIELSAVVAQNSDLQKRLDELHLENDAFDERERAIEERRVVITAERTRQTKLQGNLNRFKRQLHTLKNAPSLQLEQDSIKKKLQDINVKRLVALREYTRLSRSVIPRQAEMTKCTLEFLQVGANKAALKALCDEKDTKFNRAQEAWNRAAALYQERKTASEEALQRVQEVIGDLEGEIKDEFHAVKDVRAAYDSALAQGRNPDSEGVDLRTLDELNQALADQEAKLDFVMATNPGVLEQYENRKRAIEVLEKTLKDRQAKADKVERNIKNARENWQPALEKLVTSIGTKFSAAFTGLSPSIGCAGEIRIRENEDYDKWAIDIMVKFRDEEKLQLLTGQRQSGGERSLTTILYLLSLTEEARAPFSLVDEINQGMDQRAERAVHDSLVNVTCQDDSAQYFLITPKLLTDLKYHERMKILCINNGYETRLGGAIVLKEMVENFSRIRPKASNVN